jgi:hypothetical protein
MIWGTMKKISRINVLKKFADGGGVWGMGETKKIKEKRLEQ